MKQRFEARPCLGEKGFSTEDGTELFWSQVARDFERQVLQTGPVSTGQNYSPAMSHRSARRHDGRRVFNGGQNSATCLDQVGRHRFSSLSASDADSFLNWPARAKAPRLRTPVSLGVNRPGHGRVFSFTPTLHMNSPLLFWNASQVGQPRIQSDLFENKVRKRNRSDRILGSIRILRVE